MRSRLAAMAASILAHAIAVLWIAGRVMAVPAFVARATPRSAMFGRADAMSSASGIADARTDLESMPYDDPPRPAP